METRGKEGGSRTSIFKNNVGRSLTLLGEAKTKPPAWNGAGHREAGKRKNVRVWINAYWEINSPSNTYKINKINGVET